MPEPTPAAVPPNMWGTLRPPHVHCNPGVRVGSRSSGYPETSHLGLEVPHPGEKQGARDPKGPFCPRVMQSVCSHTCDSAVFLEECVWDPGPWGQHSAQPFTNSFIRDDVSQVSILGAKLQGRRRALQTRAGEGVEFQTRPPRSVPRFSEPVGRLNHHP